MIYSLEGTPGTGKTLFMVQKIIPDFLNIKTTSGGFAPVHVWHNIEGFKPELTLALLGLPSSLAQYFHKIGYSVDEDGNEIEDERYLQYFYLDPETIQWIQVKDEKGKVVWTPDWETAKYLPLNSVILLDELQNIFSSRDFAETFSKKCIKYLTRHRHYGHTIWWASQNVEQVDVTFRRNTQYVWFLESLENFGMSSMFKISKYEGWLCGNKTMTLPYATERVAKKKQFFKCYKSHVSGDVKEVHYKTNIILANKPLMVVICIIVIALIIAIVNGNPFNFNKNKSTAPTDRPAPSKGFSPSGAGEGEKTDKSEEKEQDVGCVQQTYVYKGKQYLVIGGEPQEPKGGVNYVKCD